MTLLNRAWLAALVCTPLTAHDFRAGDIVIDHPYAVVASASVQVRGLRNRGAQPDRLLGGHSPLAGRLDLLHDGQPAALPLPPGATVPLRHDGPWRLALRDLKAPLKPGDTVPVTLRFERGGEVTVRAEVVDPGTRHRH